MKQRWFCVDSKSNFVLLSWYLKNYNLYINVEKINLFQRRNNVILSKLNQRWNSTLKQRWFWVDTENNFILILWYWRNYNLEINVEIVTVFQRRNNVILSTLNQRRNLTLKQRWFWVDTKKLFAPILWCSKSYSLYINAVKTLYFNVETTSFDQRCINIEI